MDFTLIVFRILHIVLGVFWAGTLIFTAFFLIPSLREAGPDAAKVTAGLMKRKFLTVMPVVALITILSGLWLYSKVSVGFQPEYMRSKPGMAIGIGGLSAIVAFLIGVTVVRPSMLKAIALSQGAASASPPDKEARLAEAAALRVRAGKAGVVVALLLILTAGTMAIARFL